VRVALREQHGVAGDQLQRRLPVDLDVALAFGDQVKNHDALRAGLQNRSDRVGALREIAPRRGELRIDEDRTDQVHDLQCLRQRVHQLSATSMCSPTGVSS
jgi:hypothetical protein